MAQATMFFPSDFLWGTATAAYQVEGNSQNNDWWQWEQQSGAISDGQRSGAACNWWAADGAEADLDRAAALGTNALRLSLAWERIEPEPAHFDSAAIARYRAILLAMRARGIVPMVTLHHFVNPLWLTQKGDFDSALSAEYFARYASKVAEELGDLVGQWVTFNEPMVYCFFRYLSDAFPAPAQRGVGAGMRALRHMLAGHAAAYRAIKAVQPAAQVGVAKHFRPIRPANAHLLARRWARFVDWFFNDMWLDALTTGQLRRPLGRGPLPDLADTLDFVGINYYGVSYTAFPPWPGRFYTLPKGRDSAEISHDGFGVEYAPGLYDTIVRALKYNKPLYITENGVPDADDSARPAYILRHLREIWRALSFNFPVMGYYHWSLIDNFEWDRGWSQRFGLIALDPATQQRTPRPSAQLYSDICHANGISSAMAATYAPHLLDEMFPG